MNISSFHTMWLYVPMPIARTCQIFCLRSNTICCSFFFTFSFMRTQLSDFLQMRHLQNDTKEFFFATNTKINLSEMRDERWDLSCYMVFFLLYYYLLLAIQNINEFKRIHSNWWEWMFLPVFTFLLLQRNLNKNRQQFSYFTLHYIT